MKAIVLTPARATRVASIFAFTVILATLAGLPAGASAGDQIRADGSAGANTGGGTSTGAGASADADSGRCSLWIDLYTGEPTSFTDILDDLHQVRVIYLGEGHTLERHHRIQADVVNGLADRGDTLVLGLEMLETYMQPEVDRYWKGEIPFDTLAARVNWSKRWGNYAQYREPMEAARRRGFPILALNARREVVHQVGMEGLEKLPAEDRAQLPAEIVFNQPMYEAQMNTVLQVHAKAMGMPGLLQTMYQAQVVRDETMANTLAEFLKSDAGRGRRAIVILGAGHCQQGMGTPSRVRRRIPGITDRIIVMSQSGDVELSEAERKLASGVEITHAQLGHLQAPLADYLHVMNLRP
jgi:uncharacterized iron-regulated protein